MDYWTEELEEKLIELWKQNACLYDISCKAYSDRAKKRTALDNIAQEMNITADAVQKHLQSLRTQYGRLKKKPASGSGFVQLSRRQVWLEKQLYFLSAHIKVRPSQSNLELESDDGSILEDRDDSTTKDFEEIPQSSQVTGTLSDDYDEDTVRCKKRCSHPGPSKRIKSANDKAELEILKTLAQSISGPPEAPVNNHTSSSKPDEDELFGQYVAAELRKISEPRAKYVLKHQLSTAIFNANMGIINSSLQQQQQYMQSPIQLQQFYTQPSHMIQQACSYQQQPPYNNSVNMNTVSGTDPSVCGYSYKQSSGTATDDNAPLQPTVNHTTCQPPHMIQQACSYQQQPPYNNYVDMTTVSGIDPSVCGYSDKQSSGTATGDNASLQPAVNPTTCLAALLEAHDTLL